MRAPWKARPGPKARGGRPSADHRGRPRSPLDNVFRDERTPNRSRAHKSSLPLDIRNGPASASGGREDGDYNLEAFVSAETTLADGSARATCARDCRSGAAHDRQYLIDLVDEAGYFTGDLDAVAERLGAPLAEVEAVLGILQTFDPPGVCRARTCRMPGDSASGTRSLRSRHAGAGRAARSPGAARFRRPEEDLRRRRRGSRRHGRGDPQAQSEARPRVRFGAGAADRAGRIRAPGARRRLDRRTQRRHAAESAGQPEILRARFGRPRSATPKNPIWPSACRPPPGWSARSTSAPAQSSRSRTKSCGSKTRSSRTASSICARSI